MSQSCLEVSSIFLSYAKFVNFDLFGQVTRGFGVAAAGRDLREEWPLRRGLGAQAVRDEAE